MNDSPHRLQWRHDCRPDCGTAALPRAEDPLWYKDAVIYQIHIKSFFDGNNDGVGDFPGLMQKLDYISELGVTAMSGCCRSTRRPRRDDGYDIAEYTSVHSDYGDMDDVRRFIEAAHARNLRVITELVINHTSDQHPWFQAARRAPPGSPERERYVWSDTDEKYNWNPDHLPGHRNQQLDLGPRCERLLLAPLLLAPARPEFRQPGRAGGRAGHHALLAGPWH